jgi:hypothetical protein
MKPIPRYLHSVYRSDRSIRRVYLGESVLEINIGGLSRRAARRLAAREIHAENVFQSRVRVALADGYSQFAAEAIAAAR